MASSPHRAVITGSAVFSSIGLDPDSFWAGLVAGHSGIRPINTGDVSELPYRIAGDLLNFEPKKYIISPAQRKSLKVMSRTVQMGVAVAQAAFDACGLPQAQRDPTRAGIEYGSAMIHTELDDISRAAKTSTNCKPGSVSYETWGAHGLEQVPPLWMLKYLPNMPACHVAIFHDLQGPSNTITSGDVSSALAIGEAYRIIARGHADFMLVGGCDSKLNPLNFIRQSLFQPLTPRNDDPARAVRPYAIDRDGTALSEAAAAFTLENAAMATKRGANVLAEIVGFACGFDRARDGIVSAKVIRRALADAGITPADIDHVNGHGVGTVAGDLLEAKSIAAVFGKSVPVWSLKGNIGSGGPGGSIVELFGSVLALQRGELPPTLNCDVIDPACEIDVHREGMRKVTKPYAIKLSYTDLGQVSAVVIKKA